MQRFTLAATSSNRSVVMLPPLPSTSPTNDIRAIKAPVDIPSAWTWLWWTLGGLLLLALLWWAWKWWNARRLVTVPQIVIPPHERALQKLREALTLLHQPRPFCISVSDTIRVYLEERFSFHAPERTTEEFMTELQATVVMTLDQKRTLGDFLERCDLVKFARYAPSEPELRNLYDSAVRLIEETQPSPLPMRPEQMTPGALPVSASPQT